MKKERFLDKIAKTVQTAITCFIFSGALVHGILMGAEWNKIVYLAVKTPL